MTTIAAPRRHAYGAILGDVEGTRGAGVLHLVLLLAIGLGVILLIAVAIMSASIDVASGLSPYAPGAPDLVRPLA